MVVGHDVSAVTTLDDAGFGMDAFNTILNFVIAVVMVLFIAGLMATTHLSDAPVIATTRQVQTTSSAIACQPGYSTYAAVGRMTPVR